MSGYARRPGVSPLSRARSLVIPDAAASSERRAGLPQLDCGRPRGRDPDPHLLGLRPAFMCYVPSPVLASVGDPDFIYGKGKGTKPGAQEILFGDEKLADLEEANPFSFKEFLKTKNLSLLKEDAANSRLHAQEATRHSLGLDCSSPPSQPVGFGLDFQQPFFEDPTGAGDLLDEDEDEDGWNGAYLPSAMEQTHSRVPASASPCSTYISFFSSPSELAGPESLPPWTLSDSDSRVSPVASPSADFAAHGECLGDRHLRTLQISYEALKDENSKLRRKLTEVQSFSETQTEMVRTLERKLEAKMIKEESDYHDLESVVQQVEQNLELMTKRAVKAESHVMKLKQDISLLQAQVSNFKRENEALRSGQGASLTVVKQNTDVALQNLRMVMSNAHTSIKQLVSGAETLNLVAEILKSIDRISEIKEVGEEES
ncbi:endosome-associated-trafficking regulator 1 isoform X2 [Myotis yumanensis]|uniref:endosome-associated-trafficking regulator 1 isoform X2 n=1 Tax=Myotis yumanensis TaxID=159337 RepID=UPI0038D38712